MSADIGRQLKEARESLGLTLEDIQEKTRILKGHLIAIENGQFDKLPSPYYARKYLRQYAEAVGLEPQHILRRFRTDEMTQEKLLEWTQSMPAVNPEEHGPSQTTGKFATERLEQTSVHRPGTTNGQVYRNDSQSVHSTQRLPALLSDPGAKEQGAPPAGESSTELMSLSRTNPPVSVRGRGRRNVTHKRKKSASRGKQRMWVWALSGVLLVSITAGGVYSFLNNDEADAGKAATGKNQVTLSNAGKVDPSAQLTLVDKNEDTNKYELRSQKQLHVMFQSIDVCRVVIAEQRNGTPIKDVTLRPGEEFEYEGAHAELWVHLQFPQNIRMLVNGKPVDPSFYVHIVKKLT